MLMSLKRISSLAVASVLVGAVSFALGCGGSESHDPATHPHPGDEEPVTSGGDHAGGGEHGGSGEHADHGGSGDRAGGGDRGNHSDHSDHGDDEPAALTPEQLVAAEMEAFEKARPVFEEHCSTCHMPGNKPSKTRKKALKHFSMGSYPFGGHHAHELATAIPKALGAAGDEATMPKDDPGAVQGEQLDLVLAWAAAHEKARAVGAGQPEGKDDGHEHKH